MEKLFSENAPLIDLSLGSDGKTLTYSLNGELWYRELGGGSGALGQGASIRMLDDSRFLACDEGALLVVDKQGSRSQVKAKGSFLKNLAKGIVNSAFPSSDGAKAACCIGGLTKKNTWGAREYLGIVHLDKSEVRIFDFETYGGCAIFSPGADLIALNALEVKGGYVYILDCEGDILGQFLGMAPAFSPSGKKVAYRKEGAIRVAQDSEDEWKLSEFTSQPDTGMGQNYNPPVWINEETVVYDSSDELYRFDLAKNNAKKIATVPGMISKRIPTLAGPYKNGVIVLTADGAESVVFHIPVEA